MNEQLDLSAAAEECKKKFTELQFMEKNSHDGTVIVEVQNQRVYLAPNASYVSVSRIVFSRTAEGCVNYAVQALFTNVQTGVVENISKFMDICSIISDSGGYKFCPGIPEKKYFDEYYSVIHYHIKSIRIWEQPFKQIDSRNCLLLHQLAANAKHKEKIENTVLRKAYKRLICDLAHQCNRSTVSPSKQTKRLQPSPTFKLMWDITLEEDQSDELSNVVTNCKLEEIAKKDLDMIFTEADDNNVGCAVREILVTWGINSWVTSE